jgi:two-component system, LytTR family, response regulator LytT
MYKTLIVEDERIVAEHIKAILLLKGITDIEITAKGKDAIAYIETEHPEFVILDIELQDNINGIQVAKFIEQKGNIPYVFLSNTIGTAENKYFSEIAKLNYYAYLPKMSWLPDQFWHFIEIALYEYSKSKGDAIDLQNHSAVSNNALYIKEKGIRKKLLFSNIDYVENAGDYVRIFAKDSKPLLYKSSTRKFAELLAKYNCIQIHQSTIVNLNFTVSYDETNKVVALQNGILKDVGKTFVAEVKKHFSN